MLVNKGNEGMTRAEGENKKFLQNEILAKEENERPRFSEFLLLRPKSWAVKSFYFPNSCISSKFWISSGSLAGFGQSPRKKRMYLAPPYKIFSIGWKALI